MMSSLAAASVAVVGTAGLVFAPAPGADTALWVRGASVVEIPIAEVLARVPAGYGLQEVDYPAGLWPWTGLDTATGAHSIAAGVPALDQAIRAAQGHGQTLVIGESLGSVVVDQKLRDLVGRPDAPDPSTVRFEVIAAPGRPGGLLSYLPVGAYEPLTGTRIKPVPETPHDVTVIKLQYDAIASWPDRPWHLLSLLNAVAGGVFYDGTDHYGNAAQDVINGGVPSENISTTVNSQGGVTTTYSVQQNPRVAAPAGTDLPAYRRGGEQGAGPDHQPGVLRTHPGRRAAPGPRRGTGRQERKAGLPTGPCPTTGHPARPQRRPRRRGGGRPGPQIARHQIGTGGSRLDRTGVCPRSLPIGRH